MRREPRHHLAGNGYGEQSALSASKDLNMGNSSESTPSKSDQPETVGWEFVSMGDYIPPTFVGLSKAVRKWTALKSFLRGPREENLTPAKSESDLRALPQVRLENLAPPIDWEDVAKALDVALLDWLEADDSEPTVCFLIGQPWCGHGKILEKWAAMRDADLITTPSSSVILRGEPDWLPKWGTNQRLWVLPCLERCYLRHVDGLTLIRAVLERAVGGDLGRGVIGCDSWTWAYLQRVWPLAQPKTLTLQAFDGDKLTRLFACPAKQGASRRFRICHAKTGTLIIPSWEEIAQGDYVVSKEFKQLAAHCRGNPGTAWAYWRNRLRSEPDAVENTSWGTHYRIRAYPLAPRQQFRFTTDLTIRGKAALSQAGVEFCAAPYATGQPNT
jgi:hypothetical protein